MNGDECMDKRAECENTNDNLNETRKTIIDMVCKIEEIDHLNRIYELAKYLYIYK